MPIADSCSAAKAPSLDHLVGAQQNRWGYGKTERLGGLAVHDHLKFCWKLHREIVRLLAAQNAIDINRGATNKVYPIDSVGLSSSNPLRLPMRFGSAFPWAPWPMRCLIAIQAPTSLNTASRS